MIDSSEEKIYKKGDIIIKENTINNKLYILKSGKVNVILESIFDNEDNIIKLDSTPTMYNLYMGDILGELSIIDLEPAAATVVADSDVTCIVLSAENIFKAIGEDKDDMVVLVSNLARIISRRLRNANKKLVKYFIKYNQQ